MFYERITQEQVQSVKALVKFLRKLQVCGTPIWKVESCNNLFPAKEAWSYSMRMTSYFPDMQKTPVEVAEDALVFFCSNRF